MVLSALLIGLAPGLVAGGDQPLPRTNALVAHPIESQEEAQPSWVGSVLLSLIDTRGNTENQSAAIDVNAVLEREINRYTTKFYWLYSDQEGVLTERKAGASFQYDYLAGEDYYYTASAAIETDERADLDLRYRVGFGVGYDVLKSEKTDFSTELGLNYIQEEFDDGSDSDAIALNLGYDLEHRLNERTKFVQSFDIYPAIDDFHDVYARVETGISNQLSADMLASISSVFDWDNTPAAGAGRRDHRLVISLGWSFGG